MGVFTKGRVGDGPGMVGAHISHKTKIDMAQILEFNDFSSSKSPLISIKLSTLSNFCNIFLWFSYCLSIIIHYYPLLSKFSSGFPMVFPFNTYKPFGISQLHLPLSSIAARQRYPGAMALRSAAAEPKMAGMNGRYGHVAIRHPYDRNTHTYIYI